MRLLSLKLGRIVPISSAGGTETEGHHTTPRVKLSSYVRSVNEWTPTFIGNDEKGRFSVQQLPTGDISGSNHTHSFSRDFCDVVGSRRLVRAGSQTEQFFGPRSEKESEQHGRHADEESHQQPRRGFPRLRLLRMVPEKSDILTIPEQKMADTYQLLRLCRLLLGLGHVQRGCS